MQVLRPTLCLITLAALTALAARCSALPPAPPHPGDEIGRPYLKRPAFTASALDRQVEGDPQLFARYGKHFGASAPDLRRALRHLAPTTLAPGRYTVWLTKRDGLRYPTVQERSTPTPAFRIALGADLAVESLLEAGTGNPIAPFRPAENVEVVVEEPPPRVVEVEVPHEVLVPIPPEPAEH